MVVIVTKKMSMKPVVIGGFRVCCEHCGDNYTYIHEEEYHFENEGIPLVSSDNAMQRKLLEMTRKRLRVMPADKPEGARACTHCGKLQSWMIMNLRKKGAMTGLAIGVVVGAIAGIVYTMSLVPPPKGLGMVFIMLFWGIAGAAICAGIGYACVSTGAKRAGRDPLSIDDERLGGLLQAAQAQGEADPAMVWWLNCFDLNPGAIMVSHGLQDFVDDGAFEINPWPALIETHSSMNEAITRLGGKAQPLPRPPRGAGGPPPGEPQAAPRKRRKPAAEGQPAAKRKRASGAQAAAPRKKKRTRS